jgi:transposase InsO family protein
VHGRRGAGRIRGRGDLSNQGGEYTGEIFAQACRSAGVTQSMGRTGSALDTAVAESLNTIIEWELLHDNHFHVRQHARHAVADWIDGYNNSERRHSTNGMLSPSTASMPALSGRPRAKIPNPTKDGRHEN